MVKYNIDILDNKKALFTGDKIITSVFLIAFKENNILSCRNERGWDIPGGHIEPNETLEQSLKREVFEETGTTFYKALPFALLTPKFSNRSMLFFTTEFFSIGKFEPSHDAFERDVLSIEDLLNRYHGDQDLLKKLISYALDHLNN
ncbi:hypothetical protein GCM10011531_07120 [Aquaticitalea lipolytica]|uniref:Nudix hydrolase domain-containing protein n=1 Tax=Aquaticitalea lipolytica TaxID=1247562 RepID=A0A8J2XFN2_9FLAO|nr:NUDIX domain-containing protein [Aquaticitalea lipolytica]GFZ79772.1 hypothetical protein GCM10011531_07120 [Aquaticitalea lipolytica]